jgi:hypothetical protein
MTTKADFAKEEWDSLVQLPRWVVAAASAAQRDLPHRTNAEVEAGLIASARGRETGNTFLAEVGADTLRIFDSMQTVHAIEFDDHEAGIATVLQRATDVNSVLGTRATPADAQAYRDWLLAVTDVVIAAARSHDFLGFGGQRITAAEQQFRDRLAAALQA